MEERRKNKRIFFSLEDGAKGIIAFPDPRRGVLVAHIVNISEGGMGLAMNREDDAGLKKGELIVITHITGMKGLEQIVNVDAVVRWVFKDPAWEYTLFGCEFLDLREDIRRALASFIDSWVAR